MSTKQKLLEMLHAACGGFVSGEQIAQELNISRNAVWKAVNTLRAEHHEVESVSGKGYRLSLNGDILTAEGATFQLSDKANFFYHIEVLPVVKSTNENVRVRATEHEGLVIAAREQTKGSGRMGRTFHSPSETGIYFSVLLKPALEASQAVFITSMAAVAVCRAIESMSDKRPKIKWVNDIFIDDKKVCGILTQAVFDMENNRAEYIVLGIGVNVYAPNEGFSPDIADIASAVFDDKVANGKNILLARILEEFYSLYSRFDIKSTAGAYKSYSFVIGKNIEVISPTSIRAAKVLDIDNNCNLIVEYENKETATLSHGEISIKAI